ncbi:12149_t:CDS:1, partial [Acaulospora colombiana]
PFPVIEVTSNLDAVQELELARLQNAELEAKSAFLEETIDEIRKATASKDAQLKQASITIDDLERQCESERRAKEKEKLAAEKLVELTSAEVEKQVLSTLEAKVAEAVKLEAKKWMSRINYLTAADGVSRQWETVRMNAVADLEVVQQMQATLRVFAAGVDAITPVELP